jgi:putative flippase GtrA
MKPDFLQFIKFGLVGVSNTLVAWACYYFFLWVDEDLYVVGSVVGGIVSIANAFYWNDKYVFKSINNDWKSKLKRLGRTYISYSGTSVLGVLLLWAEVSFFGISKVLAPPINLLITVPLNFLINKYWTFGNK